MKTFQGNVRVLGNSSSPGHRFRIQKWKREMQLFKVSLMSPSKTHFLEPELLCLLNRYDSYHFLISNLFFKL